MRIRTLEQVRQAELRRPKRAAPIDLVHEFILFGTKLQSAAVIDSGGIVDEDINASKAFDSGGDHPLVGSIVHDVDLNWQHARSTRLLALYSLRPPPLPNQRNQSAQVHQTIPVNHTRSLPSSATASFCATSASASASMVNVCWKRCCADGNKSCPSSRIYC